MRTLKQIAQLIIENYSGGDATVDSKIHVRDVIAHVRQAMNEILKVEYWTVRNDGDRGVPTMYIATYTGVAIQMDKTERTLYLDLPQGYQTLPHNKGVHNIHLTRRPSEQVYISHQRYVSDILPAGHLENEPGCWIEGLKVKFRNHSIIEEGDTAIVKLIIAAPDSIGENDVLPIYPEQEGLVMDLVARRIIPSFQTVHDALNEGNKDIGVTVNG